MFNLLNEKEAEFFHRRWKEYVAENFPDIDSRIKMSVVKLSTIPGVIPMWSCSGHTLKEQGALERRYSVPQSRYIIFGVHKDDCCFEDIHKIIFERFEKWYRDLNIKTFRAFRPRLETTYLTNQSVPGEYTISPVWKLSFNYRLQTKGGIFGADPVNLEVEWEKLITCLSENC